MGDIVKYEQVKDKVIILRGEPVLLDADVATLYGVETKRVNEAVKNNPDKFPEGYLFKLSKQEVADLRSKILMSRAQDAEKSTRYKLAVENFDLKLGWSTIYSYCFYRARLVYVSDDS